MSCAHPKGMDRTGRCPDCAAVLLRVMSQEDRRRMDRIFVHVMQVVVNSDPSPGKDLEYSMEGEQLSTGHIPLFSIRLRPAGRHQEDA